jgi:hypothetical protein
MEPPAVGFSEGEAAMTFAVCCCFPVFFHFLGSARFIIDLLPFDDVRPVDKNV